MKKRELADSDLKILVVEDEPDLRDAMVSFLNLAGFVADGVGSTVAADLWMQTHEVDVIILDIGLPDRNGIDWLRQTGELKQKGLILATARGELEDRIIGLQAGADAYLVKPVALEEMVAVVRNVAARVRAASPRVWHLHPVHWQLDAPGGASMKLTRSETIVLQSLAANPGVTCSRDALIRNLGYEPQTYDPRRMEILVRRLRNKAREQLNEELPLETVHGQGYAFTAAIRLLP